MTLPKRKIPLRDEDLNPVTRRILDRSNWFVSQWVQNTFGLYYILIDLQKVDVIMNRNHRKKIAQSLTNMRELHDKTTPLIDGMRKHLADSDRRYCEWHEVPVAPKTKYETNWEESVKKYEESKINLGTVTPTNYDTNPITAADAGLTDLVCTSSFIGYGSEMYEILCLIDQLRDGPLARHFYQKLRGI